MFQSSRKCLLRQREKQSSPSPVFLKIQCKLGCDKCSQTSVKFASASWGNLFQYLRYQCVQPKTQVSLKKEYSWKKINSRQVNVDLFSKTAQFWQMPRKSAFNSTSLLKNLEKKFKGELCYHFAERLLAELYYLKFLLSIIRIFSI